jgi:hypothetical protein
MPFAVVNHVRFSDADLAAVTTHDVVLPRLRQLPGFESAIFLEDGARAGGFSVMVFATREQADGMAARLGSGQVPAPDGIVFEHQEVFDVVAST